MISNAKILRLDLPLPMSTGGRKSYAPGPALDIPCTVDGLNEEQRRTSDREELNASMFLYVNQRVFEVGSKNGGMGDSVKLEPDQMITVRQGTELARTYRIRKATLRTKGSLSHWQAFLSEEEEE